MSKIFTIASAFALSAIMATGITYAVEGTTPDASEEFTILSSTPEDGATMAAIAGGSTISITPSCFDEYPELYIQYQIDGLTEGEESWENVKSFAPMTRGEGVYTAQLSKLKSYTLYSDTKYRISFTAWKAEKDSWGADGAKNAIGTAYIYLNGTEQRYQNSPYKLVSVSPDPTENASEGPSFGYDCPYITVTFDGPVNLGDTEDTGILGGQGMPNEPFDAVEPVDGKEVNGKQYAEVWHLCMSESMLKYRTSQMEVTLKATDEEGRVLKGTNGTYENSYTLFTYNVPGMYSPLGFDFGAQPAAALNEVIVWQDAEEQIGINYSYNVAVGNAVVTDSNGEVVARVASTEKVYADGDEDNLDAQAMKCRLVLDTPVSGEGKYTMTIPGGYFNFGSQFNTLFQAEQSAEFELVASPTCEITPAPGVVEQIQSIAITYTGYQAVEINEESSASVEVSGTIINEDGEEETVSIVGFYFTVSGNTLYISRMAAISEPGEYTVSIPSGFVKADGEALPNMIFSYTIEADQEDPEYPAVFDPAPGKVDALPTEIVVTFTDWSEAGIGGGKATISCDGGEAVALPDADYGVEWNQVNQPLGEFAGKTDDGTYTIHFPAGYFSDASGNPAPEMTITYTIGDVAPDYPATFTPAAGSTMEALPEQIDIVFPDYSSAGLGAGKATIQFNSEDPVNLGDADYGIEWNEVNQPLGEFAGKDVAGTYTITFPAGYFLLGDNGEDCPEMVITYTVSENTGVTGITVKADRYVVFDVNGVKVLDTADEAEFKALKGLYIVNGLKMVLK